MYLAIGPFNNAVPLYAKWHYDASRISVLKADDDPYPSDAHALVGEKDHTV